MAMRALLAVLGALFIAALPIHAVAFSGECRSTANDLLAMALAVPASAETQGQLKYFIEKAVRLEKLGDELGCLSRLAEVRQLIATR
jgi:hypothetical protein